MPLPKNNSEWPPKPFDVAFDQVAQWHTWWEGTSSKLTNFGPHTGVVTPSGFVSRVQAASDAFFGKQAPGTSERRLHLPVAGDIARLMGSLMFGNPPRASVAAETVEPEVEEPAEPQVNEFGIPVPQEKPKPVVKVDPAQERIDKLCNDERVQSMLTVAGETASALGGVFLRVVWDQTIRADQAWLEMVDPDRAIPEFVWGYLSAITFWNDLVPDKQVEVDQGVVYRHFQRYERGRIQHALYRGTNDNVGIQVGLNEHTATQLGVPAKEYDMEGNLITDGVDSFGFLTTGVEGMGAVYVPNRRPNPAWRRDNQLKMLGMSDFPPDVIPIFMAIDEVYSSLMRDVRQGKGRMVVSENLLEVLGQGKGTGFNIDRELFSPVGESVDDDGRPIIEQVQFEIRDGQHINIITMLLKEALRRVGVSPMSFGLVETVATTATEIKAWTADTNQTIESKRRLWAPELRDIYTDLIEIDAKIFPATAATLTQPIELDWPDVIAVSDREKAETLNLLKTAEAMSLRTRVAYLHDDWDDAAIEEEVDRIREDGKAAAPVIEPPFAGGESAGAPGEPDEEEVSDDDEPTGKPAFGS